MTILNFRKNRFMSISYIFMLLLRVFFYTFNVGNKIIRRTCSITSYWESASSKIFLKSIFSQFNFWYKFYQ